MVSSGEMADFVTKALETRKPPKLTSSQLETLTIIAYYQPATKAMVEQIRGVDSAYSVAALLNKKLIEESGRLNVPGRPILYQTTETFLRAFGLSSVSQLPALESFGEPDPQQMTFRELEEPTMISEDFSWYQRTLPGVFFFLGTGNTSALHATTFNFDEEILLKGADFFEKLAEEFQ